MAELKLKLPFEISEEDALFLLCIKLVETGRLSTGEAAQVTGYTRREFVERFVREGGNPFPYSPSDVEMEVDNLETKC